MTESSIPRFFEKDVREKLNIIADFSNLSEDELNFIKGLYDDKDFQE